MTILVGLLAGMVMGVSALVLTSELFSAPAFMRANYRGKQVPVGVGVLVPLATLGVLAVTELGRSAGDWSASGGLRAGETAALIAATGFGLLGIFDDLAASGDTRGFSGHVRAIVSGSWSTGAVKLVCGGLIGLYVAALLHADAGPAQLILDGALIALAANTGNLFDRAPGRCIKVVSFLFVILVIGTALDEAASGAAVVVGAGVAMVGADLKERLMLGDAGSNALGAAVGVAAVATLPAIGRIAVLLALVALNVASERVSFSQVISKSPVLRSIDQFGRRN